MTINNNRRQNHAHKEIKRKTRSVNEKDIIIFLKSATVWCDN